MIETLRDLLTAPNPSLDRQQLKNGSTTKSTGETIGPHKTLQWIDFSLAKINVNFADILSRSTYAQKLSYPDFEPRWQQITEEDCFKLNVLKQWNEPIINRALKATAELLKTDKQDLGFLKGDVILECVTGKRRLATKLPNETVLEMKSKPDWWCFQSQGVFEKINNTETILLFGETKPSTKFKSIWIESTRPRERKMALRSLSQLTRCMMERNMRYGCLMTDTEFVPIRLSRRLRSTINNHQQSTEFGEQGNTQSTGGFDSQSTSDYHDRSHTNQISRNISFMEGLEERLPEAVQLAQAPQTHEVSHLLDQWSQGSYGDTKRTIDIVLEWTTISWETHGAGELTYNLALWSLIMLASEKQLMDGYELEEPEVFSTSQNSTFTSQSQGLSQDNYEIAASFQAPNDSYHQTSIHNTEASVNEDVDRISQSRSLRSRTAAKYHTRAKSSVSKPSEQPHIPRSSDKSRISKPLSKSLIAKTSSKRRISRSKAKQSILKKTDCSITL